MLVKAESSIAESQTIFQEIVNKPGKIFEMMRFDFREMAEKTLSSILKDELTQFLGREKYSHHPSSTSCDYFRIDLDDCHFPPIF